MNPVPRQDIVEMARLLRKADELTAVLLLEAWGNKQRLIGGRNELVRRMEQSHAEA
ncbi:hypothetical protein IVB03_39390 [Bradyrhizobium sp. 168]|uniref:hypothetical protein n=1 Tax=Bradyrhizobium sp. 168 TaxID=2782639 RepID=UPI001FF9FA91|nr:hypothetical protein [Bradyrhizobium sp. 168]MCK1585460.1 hypothetical protein [Bradyrhizobium sp. 168]